MGSAALLLGLAVASLLAVPTLATDDADLRRRIEERFARAGLDRSTGVTVTVDRGAVRLEGVAVSLADAREAEKQARREAKVVLNQIQVVPERQRSDRAILNDAEGAIRSYSRYGAFDAVGVEVEDGMVRLAGFVLDDVRRREIEDRIARVEGVRDVHNDLRRQGFSPGDERLRQQIYHKIYTDPMFEQYASWSEPPVRVLVERGRVTLAGKVGSAVEQAAVGHLARETLAFSVSNLVQVEGSRAKEEDSRKQTES